MTPTEAKLIRGKCRGMCASLIGPHPLDGYSVAEFVKRCRSGKFTAVTFARDPFAAGAKLTAKYGDLRFEQLTLTQ